MNTLIVAATMAGALAAIFGIAFCFAWLCLRGFMAWMQSHAARPARVEARAVAHSGLLRRFAFGQKH
jgi:predicted lysophospholipase L1 biosynthesis ABC-type transport system permease subunit